MIANAMWFRTDSDVTAQNAFSFGPFSFSVHEVYTSFMSSLTIVPVSLAIVMMFTKSAPKPDKGEVAVRGRRQLPWWCVYVGWVLVVLSIAVSAFFTILFSFDWGPIKSTQWLSGFFLSFLQSIMIIQPLQVS